MDHKKLHLLHVIENEFDRIKDFDGVDRNHRSADPEVAQTFFVDDPRRKLRRKPWRSSKSRISMAS